MPDLLGPTKPVPGYDSIGGKTTQVVPNDTSIRNLVDPTRVTRSDGRTEGQNAGDNGTSDRVRYESNLLAFLQRLKQTPELAEPWIRVLQQADMQAALGSEVGLNAELSQLVEFLQMDERKLMAFLQSQIKSGTRFGGPLFQMLRTAYANVQSDELKLDILQFLRRFSDYSSTPHLEERISRMLYEMSKSLPARWAERLLSIGAQFENGLAAGDRAGNLSLLREQVFPLMAGYVGSTHDQGRARGLLSLLTLDLVRYENGDESGLIQAFRRLGNYGVLPEELRQLSNEDVLPMLKSSEWFKAANDDVFAERLAEITARALGGEGGAGMQEVFGTFLSSVLVNESVYMPLNHIVLPLEWNGRSVYSEMWVDPDADAEPEKREPGSRTLRILIQVDVQGMGAFDVLLNAQRHEVALQVACPEAVAVFSEEMARSLSDILLRNGFQPGPVRVAARKKPMTLLEVFPKLFQRTDGVNVKI
ncbi:MAG: hypothetical protein VB071_14160 [Lawsonibacter sp.]|nr:hypothetical protein [Lawsonibacter sp.]